MSPGTPGPAPVEDPARPDPASDPGPRVWVLLGQIDGQNHRWPLRAPEQILGSSSRCGLSIKAPGISRRHARLTPGTDGGPWQIEDLGSKNGTRVNGRRIQKTTPIRLGTQIRVGSVDLELQTLDGRELEIGFRFEPGPGPAKVSPAVEGEGDLTLPRTLTGAADPLVTGLLVSLVESLAAQTPRPHRRLHDALALVGRTLGVLRAELLDVAFADQPSRDWTLLAAFERSETESPSTRRKEDREEARGDEPTNTETSTRTLPESLKPWPKTAEVGRRGSSVWAWSPFQEGGGLVLKLRPEAVASETSPALSDVLARVALAWLGHLSQAEDPHRIGRPSTTYPLSTSSATTTPVPDLPWPSGHVISAAPEMIAAYREMRSVAEVPTPVLILGETGVGKEHAAQLLHRASGRSGPLVAINCAAIPEHLLESELFGIAKGVATGVSARMGKFLEAQGGTLFLDEIGDLPLAMQSKLLRVLEEKKVQPMGGRTVELDVRLISATHSDLRRRLDDGSFRPDLFYRLAGFEVSLPPLRRRPQDFAALVQEFAARTCEQAGKTLRGISVAAWTTLRRHSWPGNVRQLEHEIRRAVLLCPDGGTIDSTMLSSTLFEDASEPAAPPANGESGDPEPLDCADQEGLEGHLRRVEKRLIEDALKATRGNQTQAAKRLQISRNGLLHRLKKLDIDTDAFRDA